MKSRFLIALVTVSMILQSFTVPVFAAEYGQPDFAVESLGGGYSRAGEFGSTGGPGSTDRFCRFIGSGSAI